jgi:hypothetical protein
VEAGEATGAEEAASQAHWPGRPRPQAPTGANQVWSYTFVFDWCANGQQLKCLTVTDEWTKEGLAIEVDGRIRSSRVIEVMSRLVSERGEILKASTRELRTIRRAEVYSQSAHGELPSAPICLETN